jgi:YfiR/HmsC-like
MIGLVMQGDRIRFEVNLRAAEHAHLALSSELLKLATRLILKGPPES